MGTSETLSVSKLSTSSRPKNYKCDIDGCDKAYAKPSLLEQHKRTHSNERPFKCTIPWCLKSFLRKSHLQAHLLSHEGEDEKPFHCSVCGKGVNTRQHLKRHEITHTKSFVCPFEDCTDSFYKHQSLRHHVLSVHEKKLYCDKCDKTFTRPYRLAQHNIKYHSDTPVYQCDFQGCFSSFQTWSAMQLHMKTEHPKLKCHVCGKGCVGERGLKSHLNTHDESKIVKLWNCKYCDLGSYVKKADLLEHYKLYHDDNVPEGLTVDNRNSSLSQDSPVMDLSASACERSQFNELKNMFDRDNSMVNESDHASVTKSSLKYFSSSFRSIEDGVSIKDMILSNFAIRKLKCPKNNCDRRFRREHDLRRHLKWHELNLEKIEAYLKSLNQEKIQTVELKCDESNLHIKEDAEKFCHSSRRDSSFDRIPNHEDTELDSLIDTELQNVRAGRVSSNC